MKPQHTLFVATFTISAALVACSKGSPQKPLAVEQTAANVAALAPTPTPAPPAPPPAPTSRELPFHRTVMTMSGDTLDTCADTDVVFTLPPDPAAPEPAVATDPVVFDGKKMSDKEARAWILDPAHVPLLFSDDVASWLTGGDTMLGERIAKLDGGSKRNSALVKLSHAQVKGATTLEKQCSSSFKDRTVLASCTAALDVTTTEPTAAEKRKNEEALKKDPETAKAVVALQDTPTRITIRTSYYNFGTVGLSDKAMSDCLAMRGSWESIPHDSQDWSRAKLDYSSRKFRVAMEAAGQ